MEYEDLLVKLITTSSMRGSQLGESHGGVYIVDLEGRDVVQVLGWKTTDSKPQQRGRDSGLRGIAVDGETVYLVASEELFAYTPDFKLIGSWRNPYLKYAQEMSVHERVLYITSGGYDSILGFDLDEKKFFWALQIDLHGFTYMGSVYDPMGDKGPLLLNKLRLNNVHVNDKGMYISGLKTDGMLHFNGEAVYMSVTLPQGIHNAQPFRDGVLFIDSEADAVRYASRSGEEDRALKLPKYGAADIETNGINDSRIARQGFGRGLCLLTDRVVAVGSSPSTISVYDLLESKTLLSVNLSMDIRNEIHGIELWPL